MVFIQYGTLIIDQRQSTVKPGINYITDFDNWLKIQNGFEPRGTPIGTVCKYVSKLWNDPRRARF